MGLKKQLRSLRKRLSNAVDGFRSEEANYRFAIREVGGFEVAFRQGTADEAVIDHSFDNDIFFSGVPEYRPGPHDVIIDVGAHIGTFSMLAARRAPHGIIHAIEASEETCNYLRTNVALNRLQNVVPHHLALSNKQGMTTLHHDQGNWGHSIMKQLSSQGEQVRTDTLGNFMATHQIERCAFMKFNCEGAEFPILLDSPNDVLRRVDKMLVLYHQDIAEGYELDKLLKKLNEAGFGTLIRNQEKLRGWIVAQRA